MGGRAFWVRGSGRRKGLFFVHELVVAFFFEVFEGVDEGGDFFEVFGEEGFFDFAEGDEDLSHEFAVGGGGFGFGFAIGHGFDEFREFGDAFEDGFLGFAGEGRAFGGVGFAAECFVGVVGGLHLFAERGFIGAGVGWDKEESEGGGEEKDG